MGDQTSEVRIRPVEELDIEDIAAIDEKIGGRYRPEVWEKRLFYYLRRDPEGSFVATAGGKVVGFMLGEMRAGEFGMEEPTGWVEVLGVDPGFQGRTVGRQLASAMLDRFRAQGAHRVQTLVDDTRPQIEAFFAALGFHPAPVKALALELDATKRGS
ncbi:MAG TPA: GNAT family N-acetyltransferase [Thermoanaerobaculia bacterium]|jgi:ribosomal protein S18 acetylase RimI-like enzyme|nr:GNAT family N-acetyltransferase [Thermoanaerobaculia bacterium]